jgi:iron-sulfur cluster insertion protein
MAETATPITLSESAARRVAHLIAQEGKPGLKLRVSVAGGGCSGFQYGFSLAEEAEEGDLVVERDGVEMVVDSMSLMYLAGSEVDYVDEVVGSYFVVKNPNATASCGCGTSFSVAM